MSAACLVLASASPRRADLLEQLGVAYECIVSDIDETPHPGESAETYVERMARSKAAAVAAGGGVAGRAVLAADTTVAVDGDILGKPRDRADALAILARLSGREHAVLTAVCLSREGDTHCRVVRTDVEFVALDLATCEAYIASGEVWDKAGAYGIQGLGGALVRGIRGSYSNVVGLPLAETRELLVARGLSTALDRARGDGAASP